MGSEPAIGSICIAVKVELAALSLFAMNKDGFFGRPNRPMKLRADASKSRGLHAFEGYEMPDPPGKTVCFRYFNLNGTLGVLEP